MTEILGAWTFWRAQGWVLSEAGAVAGSGGGSASICTPDMRSKLHVSLPEHATEYTKHVGFLDLPGPPKWRK